MTNEFIGQPHDFDFLVGRWHVANRRLRQRLAGSDDWDSFDAVSQAWTHLDGQVSIDEIAFEAGYKERTGFNRAFRKIYGCEPTEYRAAAIANPAEAGL